jgi:septum formation topological specificity factor MinE
MHLIKFVESKPTAKKQKLSERFAGCITKERADELQTELIQMRKEWERNTY